MDASDNVRRRRQTVETLENMGALGDVRIWEAVLSVVRERFFPAGTDSDPCCMTTAAPPALQDSKGRALVWSTNIFGIVTLLELAGIKPGMSVLEIGAGTGYNAALLCHLVGADGRVTGIEINRQASDWAREVLHEHRFPNAEIICCDGFQSIPGSRQYDRILVSAAAPEIPMRWIERLKPGGSILSIIRGSGPPFRNFELRGWRDGNALRIDHFSGAGFFQGIRSGRTIPQGWFSRPDCWLNDECDDEMELTLRESSRSPERLMELPDEMDVSALVQNITGSPERLFGPRTFHESCFFRILELEGFAGFASLVPENPADMTAPMAGLLLFERGSAVEVHMSRRTASIRGNDSVYRHLLSAWRIWAGDAFTGDAVSFDGLVCALEADEHLAAPAGRPAWRFQGPYSVLRLWLAANAQPELPAGKTEV